VHGFRCYDNIARTRNISECLYSLYACFDRNRQGSPAVYKFTDIVAALASAVAVASSCDLKL